MSLPGGTPPPARTTRRAQILDILPGQPAMLLIAERLRNAQGATRTFTQQVQVPDEQLFQRLAARMQRGDEINVVIVTEFLEQGYRTCLVDFEEMPS